MRRLDRDLRHRRRGQPGRGRAGPDHVRVAVGDGAPASVQALMQASGGGEVPPAGLDTGNHYSIVSNGGEYTDPTYVRPRG